MFGNSSVDKVIIILSGGNVCAKIESNIVGSVPILFLHVVHDTIIFFVESK